MAVVFSDQYAPFAGFILYRTQRGEIGQVVRSDDHTASVYSYLADRSFQPCRILEHRADVGVSVFILMLQLVHQLIARTEVHLGFLGSFGQFAHDRIRELAVGD